MYHPDLIKCTDSNLEAQNQVIQNGPLPPTPVTFSCCLLPPLPTVRHRREHKTPARFTSHNVLWANSSMTVQRAASYTPSPKKDVLTQIFSCKNRTWLLRRAYSWCSPRTTSLESTASRRAGKRPAQLRAQFLTEVVEAVVSLARKFCNSFKVHFLTS